MLQNLKHLKTTIPGLLLLLAALPQNEIMQQLMTISPAAARYIGGAALLAAGAAAIFGLGAKPAQPQAK
jgi:hypothetical protein